MKKLPSGTRTSPPWPVAALNALGEPLRRLGLFPALAVDRRLGVAEDANAAADPLSRWVQKSRQIRLEAYDKDADLTLFGVLAIRSQIAQSYANMLRFERIIAQNPAILEERIERPLFVLGWPRTGTTMLQRLLCLHKDARFTPVWEAYAPLPEDGRGRPLTIAQRRAKARHALRLLHWLAPDLNAIHPMSADDPDECYHLFRNYSAMPPGWDFAHLPSYWAWFDDEASARAYQIHKRQLQLLQSYDRRGHWVLKSPQHMAGLNGLLKIYPDARIVVTHRDPVEAVASYCSLVAVAWGMTSDRASSSRITKYVLTTAARSQSVAREALKHVPPGQVIHVQYREMMRDACATASAIYDRFGYPRDPDLTSKMTNWLANNPKNRHGRHTYALSDFGLTDSEVRTALA
jgi:hypothetical protein